MPLLKLEIDYNYIEETLSIFSAPNSPTSPLDRPPLLRQVSEDNYIVSENHVSIPRQVVKGWKKEFNIQVDEKKNVSCAFAKKKKIVEEIKNDDINKENNAIFPAEFEFGPDGFPVQIKNNKVIIE